MTDFNKCKLKSKYRYGDNYDVVSEHQIIAHCFHNQDYARLFAAAPDMYELLNALVHRENDNENDNTVTAILTLEAEKILARIDGNEDDN